MVSKQELTYRELSPAPALRHLVLFFFEFRVQSERGEPIPHVVIPDGCVSLLYRRNLRESSHVLMLKGIESGPFRTVVNDSDIHWGVKFSPSSARLVLRDDPLGMATGPVIGEGSIPHITGKLLDECHGANCLEDFAGLVAARLERLDIHPNAVDSTVSDAIEKMFESNGEIRIAELADYGGLSHRQFGRRFSKATGITPKQFARFCRLRAMGISLTENDMNWAERAAEFGFTDQAHLIRELAILTGRTPRDFRQRILQTEHLKLVK